MKKLKKYNSKKREKYDIERIEFTKLVILVKMFGKIDFLFMKNMLKEIPGFMK